MATFRQRRVAQKLSEIVGKSVSQAMRESGYSPSSAEQPQRLTRSKGWDELMEQYFPDDILAKGVKGLIGHKDWRARDAGLDKAFKLKGKYTAEKVKFEDPYEDMSDDEILQKIEELKAMKAKAEGKLDESSQ